jgi:hypothetical protein
MTDEESSSESSPSRGDGPAPGWYPDPLRAATHRYWDGQRWTNDVHGGQTVPITRRTQQSHVLILLGAVALAVSPFLTWVNVLLFGSLNLFQLLKAGGHPETLGWAAVVIGGCVAFLALTEMNEQEPKDARVFGVAGGLICGIVAILVFNVLSHEVHGAGGFAAMGVGPWVAIAGSGVMVIGGLTSRSDSRR